MQQGQFEFLSSQQICKTFNFSKPTLVIILNNLNSANIMGTKEGKPGGIRLLKNPAEISVLDIFDTMEKGKPQFQTTCQPCYYL